jgi:hypothetical protein
LKKEEDSDTSVPLAEFAVMIGIIVDRVGILHWNLELSHWIKLLKNTWLLFKRDISASNSFRVVTMNGRRGGCAALGDTTGAEERGTSESASKAFTILNFFGFMCPANHYEDFWMGLGPQALVFKWCSRIAVVLVPTVQYISDTIKFSRALRQNFRLHERKNGRMRTDWRFYSISTVRS